MAFKVLVKALIKASAPIPISCKLRACNDSNYPVGIQSITIAGFRCFGPDPQLIEVAGDLTAIVGPNASGKTAVLQALCTLFGVTRARRTVRRSDFHLPPGVPPSTPSRATRGAREASGS